MKKDQRSYQYGNISFVAQPHLPVNTWRVVKNAKKEVSVGVVAETKKEFVFTPEASVTLNTSDLSNITRFLTSSNALKRADKQNKKTANY